MGRFWNSQLPQIKGNPKVSLICVAYERPVEIKVLISSILAQTYRNFELIVVHDGPSLQGVEEVTKSFGDPRVLYFQTEQRGNKFGHDLRELATRSLVGEANFIGHTNDDNYFVPVYLECLLAALSVYDADFAYCNMVHSHEGWSAKETRPEINHIDVGGWLVRRAFTNNIHWTNHFAADGIYVQELMTHIRPDRVVKVPGYLFVHN